MRKERTVKKILIGIFALMFFVMNAPAMAGAPKVPANLCLDWAGFSDVSQLLIKSQGTLKTSDGPVKMYSIFGHDYNGGRLPVSGNGYIVPGTTTFHATFAGNFRSGGSSYVGNWELFYDLVLQDGTIYYHYDHTNGSKISGLAAVVATNCVALPLPAIKVGGEKFSAEQ
jgi:hypothetical protein